MVFRPGAVRVSDQQAPPGSALAAGSPVLGITSADKVVTLELPAADQDVIVEGSTVVVQLPDGTDVAATVEAISAVATVSASGNPVFEVTITLDDPSVAGGLDEAPVDVEVVADSAEDVLAVPVTALLALAEGGYAVEVDAGGGTTRLVAVDPGFFAGGLVEVTSTELQEGDRVVVP
jgi:multidrug efflux pump subunit AcrA (membrane-fusion protein)